MLRRFATTAFALALACVATVPAYAQGQAGAPMLNVETHGTGMGSLAPGFLNANEARNYQAGGSLGSLSQGPGAAPTPTSTAPAVTVTPTVTAGPVTVTPTVAAVPVTVTPTVTAPTETVTETATMTVTGTETATTTVTATETAAPVTVTPTDTAVPVTSTPTVTAPVETVTPTVEEATTVTATTTVTGTETAVPVTVTPTDTAVPVTSTPTETAPTVTVTPTENAPAVTSTPTVTAPVVTVTPTVEETATVTATTTVTGTETAAPVTMTPTESAVPVTTTPTETAAPVTVTSTVTRTVVATTPPVSEDDSARDDASLSVLVYGMGVDDDPFTVEDRKLEQGEKVNYQIYLSGLSTGDGLSAATIRVDFDSTQTINSARSYVTNCPEVTSQTVATTFVEFSFKCRPSDNASLIVETQSTAEQGDVVPVRLTVEGVDPKGNPLKLVLIPDTFDSVRVHGVSNESVYAPVTKFVQYTVD